MTEYEMMVGLETHVELSTHTKLFCACEVGFGREPNTCCCPVCIGAPGSLPTLNRQALRYAALAGFALHCQVHPHSHMARKHYRYPDLAKAYQITQGAFPLCTDGYLELSGGMRIGIERIHLEEDAGKLVWRGEEILIDYNRGGVPLIEIVTRPDFRTPQQVGEYLELLQLTMRYLKISDCKMQEGSLRCDVNVSVHKKGEAPGTRTEIKNMNSFSYIRKALAYEFERQVSLLEAGLPVFQETRRYEEKTGKTIPMRSKEDADDYRYFPEPDLPAVILEEKVLSELRQSLPELPLARKARLCRDYGLDEETARQVFKYRAVADYFEEAAHDLADPGCAAKLLLGPIFSSFANEAEKEACCPRVSAKELRNLLLLAEKRELPAARCKAILVQMLKTGCCVEVCAGEDGLSEKKLSTLCRQAVENNPAAVQDYQKGKEKAMGVILGEVMRESKGQADGQILKRILEKLLSEES